MPASKTASKPVKSNTKKINQQIISNSSHGLKCYIPRKINKKHHHNRLPNPCKYYFKAILKKKKIIIITTKRAETNP